MIHLIPHLLIAIKARRNHKKYNVSADYLERMYLIDYHKSIEHWSDQRLTYELRCLQLKFPEETERYIEAK